MILVVVIVYGSIGKELLSSVLCFCLIKHRFSVKCLGFMQAVGVNRGAEASSSSVASGSKKSCHFDIVNFKEDLAIESPITDGQITDWDLLESIWDHALSNYLKVELKESPILLTEKPYNPPYARQR